MSPAGDNFSVGMFQFVPSLLTCPNLVLLYRSMDMMMPAVMVVVSSFLLMRAFGSAPSLLPWRAGFRFAPLLPLALVPGFVTGNLNKFIGRLLGSAKGNLKKCEFEDQKLVCVFRKFRSFQVCCLQQRCWIWTRCRLLQLPALSRRLQLRSLGSLTSWCVARLEIVTYVEAKFGLRNRDSKSSDTSLREHSDPMGVDAVNSLSSGKGKG